MVLNNIKTALRHLRAQKLNTAVHVVGLTLGISVCLVIALFIRYELSFDTYHKESDRTYRVNSVWIDGEKNNYTFSTPIPIAEALRTQGTAYEKVVFAHPQYKSVIELGKEKKFMEEKVLIVSPEYVDVFSVKDVDGKAQEAIRKPYYALLTETTAKKYFGTENAIGKTFKYKNEFNISVGAVIKDFPSNTHLGAGVILSFVANEHYLGTGFTQWTMVSGSSTFVVLKDNSNKETLQKHVTALADQHINADPNLPPHVRGGFEIQPLNEIHFAPQFGGGGPWGGAIKTDWLWIFASIGLAVLALAIINFVNLSTAQALTRSREVGVRKSIGAGRGQLIFQFMAEAWLLAIASGVLAITLVQVFLPQLNSLLEKNISFNILQAPVLALTILLGILLVGILAGIYPAWLIARFNPSVVLKSKASSPGQSGQWLRSCLMVTQFVISAGLLAAVLLISEQVTFLRSKTLGFDKDNVINVPIPFGQSKKLETLLEDVSQIKEFSFGTATPTANGHWGSIMTRTNADDPNRYNVTMILADEKFAPMYGLQLLSGRFNIASDTNYVSRSVPQEQQIMKCVVNETLIKTLGFASNKQAIGEKFWFGMNSGHAEIVGVVKDFNTTSLHDQISPVLMFSSPDVYGHVGIKIHAGSNIPAALEAIEDRWEKAFPEGVFEYSFLDQQIDAFYKAEARVHKLFQVFAGLAMLISCLGLWGLASYSLQQRTKEIGIRKVLGASVNSVVFLLSREFLFMVLIALVIAFPLAYFLMNNWLSNFAFHVTMGAGIFIVAGVASVLIAVFTVSFQALKTAMSNPAESLRSE